jgi:hypothetical protein
MTLAPCDFRVRLKQPGTGFAGSRRSPSRSQIAIWSSKTSELVLLPGIRLSCLARAWARGVRRFARTGEGHAAGLLGARLGARRAACGVRRAACGVRRAACGVRRAACGVRRFARTGEEHAGEGLLGALGARAWRESEDGRTPLCGAQPRVWLAECFFQVRIQTWNLGSRGLLRRRARLGSRALTPKAGPRRVRRVTISKTRESLALEPHPVQRYTSCHGTHDRVRTCHRPRGSRAVAH